MRLRKSNNKTDVFFPAVLALTFLCAVGQRSAADSSTSEGAKAFFFRRMKSPRSISAKNADEVRSIASLSKLMAAIVIAERHLKLDEITTITRTDRKVGSGGSRSRLLLGAKFTNRDLLYAALLASDNVAISALGRAVGLTPKELVSAMNRRAKLMGLKHTKFKDPVGIDHGNVSTAREVASILRAALKNRVLKAVMGKSEHFVRAVWPKTLTANYLSTNLFLHRGKYKIVGGKTGYNSKAGYCFATAIETDSHGTVLGVVLGSKGKLSRFRDFESAFSDIK